MASSTAGERLRTSRIKTQKSQQQVAKECFKSLSAYKSWEQNRARPKTDQDLINVCKAVGISIDYYVSGEECAPQLKPIHERALKALDALPEEHQEAYIEMMEKIGKAES